MEYLPAWKFNETAESYDVILTKYYNQDRYSGVTLVIDNYDAPPDVDSNGILVTSWHHMFDGQLNIKEIIFADTIKTAHVTSTRAMFCNCPNLERIVLPPFAFRNVTDASFMFQNCPKLREIVAPGLFLTKNTDGKYTLNEMVKKYSTRIIDNTPIARIHCPVSLNLLRRDD